MNGASVRRFCEFQLFLLVFALPFEYYFAGREQSLYTSLKLQAFLLSATWASMKLSGFLRFGRAAWRDLTEILPERVQLALAAFVLVQLMAACFAPEFRGDAGKAAVKVALGAAISLIAADLSSGVKPQSQEMNHPILNMLIALSCSGTCMAILGLAERGGIGIASQAIHIFQPSGYFLGTRHRLASTMEYPNTAGSFLSATFCATLALAIAPGILRWSGWRWVLPATMVIQGLAISLTYSRGALASTVIGISVAVLTLPNLIRGRHGRIAGVACLFVLAYGGILVYLARHENHGQVPPPPNRLAGYGLGDGPEVKSLLPNLGYHKIIVVENDSRNPWPCSTSGIAYRWHQLTSNHNSPLLEAAAFDRDVWPGQRVQVPVSFDTPLQEGEYLLIWFVFHRSNGIQELENSYSPAELCVIESAGSDVMKGLSRKAARYLNAIREERRTLNGLMIPNRLELWTAGLKMFRHNPLLGIGPDNFRMLKWKYMAMPRGDETILTNNLYLEILSGSGILGLAAFIWLVWECCRHLGRVARSKIPLQQVTGFFGIGYITGLLVHGAVDYFLKFTPTFLLFWLILGMCTKGRAAEWGNNADRL